MKSDIRLKIMKNCADNGTSAKKRRNEHRKLHCKLYLCVFPLNLQEYDNEKSTRFINSIELTRVQCVKATKNASVFIKAAYIFPVDTL